MFLQCESELPLRQLVIALCRLLLSASLPAFLFCRFLLSAVPLASSQLEIENPAARHLLIRSSDDYQGNTLRPGMSTSSSRIFSTFPTHFRLPIAAPVRFAQLRTLTRTPSSCTCANAFPKTCLTPTARRRGSCAAPSLSPRSRQAFLPSPCNGEGPGVRFQPAKRLRYPPCRAPVFLPSPCNGEGQGVRLRSQPHSLMPAPGYSPPLYHTRSDVERGAGGEVTPN